MCGDIGNGYEISKQGNHSHFLETAASSKLKQLWQCRRREGARKFNIILETLVIHFLSHLLAHLPLLLEFPSTDWKYREFGGGVLLLLLLLLLRFDLPAPSHQAWGCVP